VPEKLNSVLFSVLICTYNGGERLPETLRHLALLERPIGVDAELLLVNNAGTDNTDIVVLDTWQQCAAPFLMRLFHMPNPGKGHALALAIEKALGDYILICDDDNLLPADYLRTASAYLQSHPGVAILGAQAVAVAENTLPAWFKEKQWAYACGPQFNRVGNTTGEKLLWSAGMLIKKDIAQKIFKGSVPMIMLGRTGDQLVSGEDDEICLRAWLMGEETHYVPALCFQHYMSPHRLQRDYLEKLIAGFAYQSESIGAYRRLYELVRYKKGWSAFKKLKKWLAWQVYRLLAKQRQAHHAADFLYFLTRHPRWENEINRAVWRFYEAAGKPLGKP
jgi:glycosyltransferase involved in cell wall biosynthesis